MWTWRRKEPDPGPGPAAVPAALPVTRAEWRSLPPIQRVVAAHPLINPVQRFGSSLTSWQSPAYLEPLGHRVGPDEPAGVIGGLARPRTTDTPAPDMPVVQRQVRKRGLLSRLWEGPVQRAAEPDPPAFESPAPEPEFAAQEATAPTSPDEPVPGLPTAEVAAPAAAQAPMPALVLPSVPRASREADRPSMPLTSADPAVIPASPPVRTVQAIRTETPAVPAPTPDPAAESSPVDNPASVELPLVDTSTPGHGPTVSIPDPVASEPGLADTNSSEAESFKGESFKGGSFTTVPVLPLPTQSPVSGRSVPETTPPSAAPARPALPIVQRTEQASPSPRRLGLGAPILPDSGPQRTPVPLPPEPPAPEPVVENSVAEVDAPLAGAVETTVLPAPSADETFAAAPMVDELPVSRIAEGEERTLPAPSAETTALDTPTLGTPALGTPTLSTPTLGTPTPMSPPPAPTAVQRSVTASVPEPPMPGRLDTPRSGAPVGKPVQRWRDEPPLPGPAGNGLPGETAGTLEHVPAADAPITVSRMATPPPSLPTATSSRSSPLNTFHPIEVQEIGYRTPETAEPPAMPGGSVSVSPVPAPSASTPPLPVARVGEDTPAVSPIPAAVTQSSGTPPPSSPTLTVHATGISGAGVRPSLPELTVSRAVEARQSPSPLPTVHVLTGATPPLLQRTHEPGPFATEQTEAGVTHSPMATLPVSRIADSPEPASHPLTPRNATPVSAERTGTLPVARSVETASPARNGRHSTMDVVRTTQSSAPSETTNDGNGFLLSLPPVVVSRQAETPVVQREPEAPPPTSVAAPEPVPSTVSAASAPTAPTAPTAPAAQAAQPETDELVKKLFDPLLRRLKTELRLDRERRGALTDRPH